MAEPKSIRLNKAAKELNVGITTLVEFLNKKGLPIENNPNARMTPEQYALVEKAFMSERQVKENADKLEISTSTANEIIEATAVGDQQKSEDNAEVIIKNYGVSTPSRKTAKTEKVTKSAEKKKKSTSKNVETPAEPQGTVEEPSVEEPKVTETVTEEPMPTPQPEVEKTETAVEEKTDVEMAPEAQPQETEQVEPAQVQASEVVEETTVVEAVVPDQPVEAEPKFEPQVIHVNDENGTQIKILDKIDLSQLPSTKKKRSNKKNKASSSTEAHKADASTTKKETTKEKSKKETEKKETAPKEQSPVVTADTPVTAPVVEKDNLSEPVVDDKPEEASKQTAETKGEFIETQYQKLEGLKVIDKIDLSQFDKHKHSHDKKKRKRIVKEGVKVDEKTIAEVSKGDSKKTQQKEKAKTAKNTTGGNGQNKDNRGKDQKSSRDAKRKDNKKEKNKEKTEVDDAAIEKQIRDTLARLSPTGKSKTSKHNREKRQKVAQKNEEEMLREMESKKTLQVTEFVTANELATMMNIPVTKIIATCMQVGIFVSINQRLDAEAIKLIADEFGYDINFVSDDVVNAINEVEGEDNPEDLVPRNPIVTVMGHVDHGKTSLLDYIRKTNVIAGEAGGITQHIGAYEVTMPDGRKITFLDTPGHEAFTAMRARGAKVTDIVIIVIAADDKIMPQTVEAINHAQAAGCPIIFAINKIDKPGADPDRIKTELANMNLLVEEWGGKYQSQDISAKKGINVDLLLEKVLLEAEMMDLKGNPKKRGKGTVLECSLDKGRGYVAKLLVEDGTIRQGDPVVAGAIAGRVKGMYNERNQLVKEAGPSQPVLMLGLTGACQAGDTFNVMENEKEARDIANRRQQLQREQGLRTQKHMTLDEIGRRIAIGDFKELNIIVKGDVDGSVEALSDSLLKLSTEEVQVNVIHKGVGQIIESDVLLAEASDAIIIGFQVRPSVQARKMAEAEKIDIRLYSIIYDAINELKDAIEGMLSPERQEKIVANLEVREIFKISKVGTIAGCMCLDGKIQRNSNIRVIRDGIVVYTGKLASLKRFKDDVKEVVSGQDCGLNIENFNDIKVGDIIEAYDIIEVKRTLK